MFGGVEDDGGTELLLRERGVWVESSLPADSDEGSVVSRVRLPCVAPEGEGGKEADEVGEPSAFRN